MLSRNLFHISQKKLNKNQFKLKLDYKFHLHQISNQYTNKHIATFKTNLANNSSQEDNNNNNNLVYRINNKITVDYKTKICNNNNTYQ